MLLTATLITHFVEFYFTGVGHEVWYHAAVWGNVVAIIPMAILGFIGFMIHHYVTKERKRFDAAQAHDEHTRHLRAILDALDPDAESESILDLIADRVNDQTPGGVGNLRELIEAARSSLPTDPPLPQQSDSAERAPGSGQVRF